MLFKEEKIVLKRTPTNTAFVESKEKARRE